LLGVIPETTKKGDKMKITREQIDKKSQYFIISPDGFANVNGEQILAFWRSFSEMIENAESVEIMNGGKWQPVQI
jgi:hypothetical protein